MSHRYKEFGRGRKPGSAQRKILLLLVSGVALGLSRNPRSSWKIMSSTYKALRGVNDRSLNRSFHQLRKEGYIKISEKNSVKGHAHLTKKGEGLANAVAFDTLQIKKQSQWDGVWRVVLFDVPETYRRARDDFRFQLKRLGFCEAQKSVFVCPYPCRTEIEQLVDFLRIRNYVRYIETTFFDNDADIKQHFNLQSE